MANTSAQNVLIAAAPIPPSASDIVAPSLRSTDGKPLKILSPEMQRIFGGFGGKPSFQRSPTRWVEEEYVEPVASLVRGLA